jgi:hypothetical protein
VVVAVVVALRTKLGVQVAVAVVGAVLEMLEVLAMLAVPPIRQP